MATIQTASMPAMPALVERLSAITGSSRMLLLAAMTALVLALYALVNHSLGFPLDDAWIHQDFARTLAQHGRFAFVPDRSGAGSTSPLWVLLLAPAQLVPNAPLWLVVAWADLLGALALFGLAWATSELAALWLAGATGRLRALGALIAGLGVLAEWHLSWAALSGMETSLFTFLSVLLLLGVGRGWRPAWLGLLAALLTTTRPEGSVLALLVAGALAVGASPRPAPAPEDALLGLLPAKAAYAAWDDRRASPRRKTVPGIRARLLLPYLCTLVLGLVPLLALNEVAAGRLLPSTFYAKGAFYALGSSEAQRLLGYAVGVLGFLASSPLVLLGLPGALFLLWQTRHSQARGLLWLAVGWALALIGVYAIHLPVVYHNGRYLMPVLPVLLALGVAGTLRFLSESSFQRLPVILAVLAVGVSLLSIGRGAGIYRANVAYINDYQVATALWLSQHTPADALVATHDIGAIGYFSQRQVIDLGGLTQPELVPLLSDQRALVAYLKQRQVGYVVMFPDWFPQPRLLLAAVEPGQVFFTHDPAIAAIGGSDLVTYQTGWGAGALSAPPQTGEDAEGTAPPVPPASRRIVPLSQTGEDAGGTAPTPVGPFTRRTVPPSIGYWPAARSLAG